MQVLIRFMQWWYKDHTQEEVDGASEGVEREEG